MHLRDLKLAAGATVRLSVQAVDGAGNRGPAATAGITVSSRVPAPLPQPEAPMPRARPNLAAAALPQVAGLEVAILDELDKIHPATGELIPPEPEGYLAANHLWNAADRRITLHAARNEFIAVPGLAPRPEPPRARSSRSWSSTGPTEPGDRRSRFGRYHPVATKIGPVPDPIVPLTFRPMRLPASRARACTWRFTFHTAWRPASITAP